MSAGGNTGQPDAAESARLVLDRWAESLVQAVAAMADQTPAVAWQAAQGLPAETGDILWWEQPFQTAAAPVVTVWVGAPQAAWEHVGTVTLKAAGVETIEPAECRGTWSEILNQSLGGMARALGSAVGTEVTCAPGAERAPAAGEGEGYSAAIGFPDAQLPSLALVFRPPLAAALAAARKPAAANPVPAGAAAAEMPPSAPSRPRTLDLLLEVDLPVSISFGKAQLPMRDVLKLTTGSIVELNRGVDEPVEVLVNQCLMGMAAQTATYANLFMISLRLWAETTTTPPPRRKTGSAGRSS